MDVLCFETANSEELRHALAVELLAVELDEDNIPDEELFSSLCAGLVIVDQQNNVRFVHYTAQEYFESIRMARFPTGQAQIAKTCLAYLSFETFAGGYCLSDEEMDIRLQKNPLLRYASENWGHHARGDPEPLMMGQILEFLAQPSRVSCFVQAMQVSEYRTRGYSQRPPKSVPGLCAAAFFGLTESVGQLLLNGADVNAKADNGESALHWATRNGQVAVVQQLLDHGADVNGKSNIGDIALHMAARAGHKAVVRLLLEHRADIAGKDADGWEPLRWAAWSGHESVVQLLIEHGADARAKTFNGWTALHGAAWSGSEVIARLLVEHGADADAQDDDGWTAQRWAACIGYGDVARFLGRVSNITAKDRKGWGALYEEAEAERGTGLSVAAKGCTITALLWATRTGHEETERQLLDLKG
jgi:ankyrin repeat protein